MELKSGSNAQACRDVVQVDIGPDGSLIFASRRYAGAASDVKFVGRLRMGRNAGSKGPHPRGQRCGTALLVLADNCKTQVWLAGFTIESFLESLQREIGSNSHNSGGHNAEDIRRNGNISPARCVFLKIA